MIDATDLTFKDEIKNGLVLVDVYTPTCGPCRIQARTLRECEDVVKIVKLNGEEYPELALMELGVRKVPTLIWYKNGIELRRTTGLQSLEDITSVVKELTD